MKDSNGKLNFEEENVKHPHTKNDVTYFEHNETFWSKFGGLGGIYEECRAEAVGYYLTCFDEECMEVLFPGRKHDWDNIIYAAWLYTMVRPLRELERYDVEKGIWRQIHIGAAYAILQACLKAGNGFVVIEEKKRKGEQGEEDYLIVHLDRKQIKTTGKKAIGDLIRELQIFRATADVEGATKFFEPYFKITKEDEKTKEQKGFLSLEQFYKYREIAIKHKTPRRLELFYDLEKKENGSIEMRKFEKSFKGVIESHLFHHKDSFEDVYNSWDETKDYFRIAV